jgi:hypothetical protein
MLKKIFFSLLIMSSFVLPSRLFGEKCTKLTISYDSRSEWTASFWYTPCGEKKEKTGYASAQYANRFMLQPGTRFVIGPAGTLTNNINIPKVTEEELHVKCTGTTNATSRYPGWPDCHICVPKKEAFCY